MFYNLSCYCCCNFILCYLGPDNQLRLLYLTFIVIYLHQFNIRELYFLLILHLEVLISCFLNIIQMAAFWIVDERGNQINFNFTSIWKINCARSTIARTWTPGCADIRFISPLYFSMPYVLPWIQLFLFQLLQCITYNATLVFCNLRFRYSNRKNYFYCQQCDVKKHMLCCPDHSRGRSLCHRVFQCK